MAIDPVEFPLIAKRISGATRWSTDIQDGLNGDEVRNANWRDSLRRFNAIYGVKTLVDQATLEAWFMACQGPAFGFLLRDWKDYQVLQSTNGTTSRTSSTVFQLTKTYTNGYRSHARTIKRPQSGTVLLYDPSHVLIGSGYSIDYTTGIVTFSSGSHATPIFWTGNFYVPVRFREDEIPWDIIQYRLANGTGHGDLPEVIMDEVRE